MIAEERRRAGAPSLWPADPCCCRWSGRHGLVLGQVRAYGPGSGSPPATVSRRPTRHGTASGVTPWPCRSWSGTSDASSLSRRVCCDPTSGVRNRAGTHGALGQRAVLAPGLREGRLSRARGPRRTWRGTHPRRACSACQHVRSDPASIVSTCRSWGAHDHALILIPCGWCAAITSVDPKTAHALR